MDDITQICSHLEQQPLAIQMAGAAQYLIDLLVLAGFKVSSKTAYMTNSVLMDKVLSQALLVKGLKKCGHGG